MELYLSGPKEAAYLSDNERGLIWRQNIIKYIKRIISIRSDIEFIVAVDDAVVSSILRELAIPFRRVYFLADDEYIMYTKFYEYPEFTSDCERLLYDATTAVKKTIRRDNMEVFRADSAALIQKRISYRISKFAEDIHFIMQFNVPHNNLIKLSDISKLNKLVSIIDITQDIPTYYVGDISVGNDIFYQYMEVYNGE